MKNRKILILFILIFIVIIFGIIFFVISNIQKKDSQDITEYTPAEEISDAQMKQTMVVLYFIDSQTNNLKSEGRLINTNSLLQDPYKELTQLLLDGPKTSGLVKAIPENTRILDVTIENNCVTLNFSPEILNFTDETQKYNIINSILNTLSELNEVNSIKFIINGEASDIFCEEYSIINK